MAETARTRCAWAGGSALMLEYHDTEWGVPAHDDRKLFEFLILEGAQAGLSWETVLNKRRNYRAAFDGFGREARRRHDRGPFQRERVIGPGFQRPPETGFADVAPRADGIGEDDEFDHAGEIAGTARKGKPAAEDSRDGDEEFGRQRAPMPQVA